MAVYTVKNIKRLHGWDPSEDGYQASLYKDGRRIGTFGMEANGGCERFTMPDAEYDALCKHAHKALGKQNEYAKPPTDWSMDSITGEYCDQLVHEAHQLKARRRWSKKKTLFTLEGDKDGTYRTIEGATYNPKVHQYLIEKYGVKLVSVYDEQGCVT